MLLLSIIFIGTNTLACQKKSLKTQIRASSPKALQLLGLGVLLQDSNI